MTTRRSLIKAVGATLATTAVVGTAKAAENQAPSWNETFDVVIIGSGFAGLAAAIEAKKAGANVIVLEKMPTAGGNSIINGGILTATGCPQQKKHGIEDSPELLANDMLVAGLRLNYPDKVKFIADRALSNYQWCIDELGVQFHPDSIGQEGGHSVPRYVTTTNVSGAGIVIPELNKLKELGVEVRLRCYVEHIIRNPETGRVEGVQVRQGYKFPDAKSGDVKFIKADKGLILCYGGFAEDKEFRKYYDPRLVDDLQTTNQPGATGELWRETSRIGCMQTQQDWVQCGPWCNPKEKGMGNANKFGQAGAAQFGVWVDSSGKRFVNELANRKIRADAIFDLHSKGMKAYAICDQNGVDYIYTINRGPALEKMLETGVVEKFDSIDAMANAYNINVENLIATIDQVNDSIKTGKDPAFGRYINKEFKPMVTPPWYICEMTPKVHHCMGGLVTSPDGRVLDIVTMQPIPGLWAAGESVGGVHGAVRLGSCATLDCLVMGRVVGQAAAGKASTV